MIFRQRSYFWRLLYAFFTGGLVPFILLSIVFGTVSTQILENAYRDRAGEAVSGAESMTTALFGEAAAAVAFLAAAPSVSEYMAGEKKDSWLISEVNRLFSSTVIASSSFIPFIIPADGSAPLSRGDIPDEYHIASYGGWGILGELKGGAKEDIVFFGQPHPMSGVPVPLALGAPVYRDGEAVGYVIVDIDRQVFFNRIGSAAASGGALTNLFLTDSSGCILYNMSDPRIEASFLDPSLVSSGKYYVSRLPLGHGISISGIYPVFAAREYTSRITALTFIIAVVSILVSLAMAILLSRSFARPVHLLTLTMEKVSRGQLDAQCPELPGAKSGDEIAVLIHSFNRMIFQVNDLVANLVAQERDLRRAETQALQAQINPHFLYNTLNSIRSMAKLEGSKDIADMTTRLARIIRDGSYSGNGFSSVEHSLHIARDYFAIELWRWPGRFRLEESIDPLILSSRIPTLIIQPLVENALVHGLEEKLGDGVLSITGALVSGDVILTITDNGAGMDAVRLALVRERLKEAGERPVESSLNEGGKEETALPGQSAGIALINTHRRLCLIYGRPYGLDIVSSPGEGTTVTVCFPFIPGAVS